MTEQPSAFKRWLSREPVLDFRTRVTILLTVGVIAIAVTDRVFGGPSKRALAGTRSELEGLLEDGIESVSYEDAFVTFDLDTESVRGFTEYAKASRAHWVIGAEPVGVLTLQSRTGRTLVLEYADPASLGIPGSDDRAWRLVPIGWQTWAERRLDLPIIAAYQQMRHARNAANGEASGDSGAPVFQPPDHSSPGASSPDTPSPGTSTPDTPRD